MTTTGTLELQIVEGRFDRDTDTFTKMDPYVEIETRMQRFRTSVKGGAGKDPVWNETMVIDVKYVGDDLKLWVYDEDLTGSDLVCEGTIKLSSLCVNEGLDEWHELQYQGQKAGHIHLISKWTSVKMEKDAEKDEKKRKAAEEAHKAQFQYTQQYYGQPYGAPMQQYYQQQQQIYQQPAQQEKQEKKEEVPQRPNPKAPVGAIKTDEKEPINLVCYQCKSDMRTRVELENNALCCPLAFFCCCITLCTKIGKDATHKCSRCGCIVAKTTGIN